MDNYNQPLPITAWAEADRPREKLMEKGRQVLSDAELIGILIGSGTRKLTAVQLSQQILSSVKNDLNALGALTVQDLTKFPGIGEAKAITIIAALELGRRRKEQEPAKRTKMLSSKDSFEFIYPDFMDLQYEEFWIILLDRGNHFIRKINVSKGGVAGTVVDVKRIFKEAIENLASYIVMCHNHPSGNLRPSEEDIKITKRMKEAGILMDIKVLDHLIIAGREYLSFIDEGLL